MLNTIKFFSFLLEIDTPNMYNYENIFDNDV